MAGDWLEVGYFDREKTLTPLFDGIIWTLKPIVWEEEAGEFVGSLEWLDANYVQNVHDFIVSLDNSEITDSLIEWVKYNVTHKKLFPTPEEVDLSELLIAPLDHFFAELDETTWEAVFNFLKVSKHAVVADFCQFLKTYTWKSPLDDFLKISKS